MEPKNILENLPIILGALALIFIQFFLRRRRGPGGNQQEIVQDLLSEVRLDYRLAELYTVQYQTKPFMTTAWQLNKDRLSFLDQSLQTALSDAFVMAEDFNSQLAAARKHKSASYVASIDMSRLKGLFAKCQEGLEQWLLLKVGSKNPPVKVPGMFDDLLGKR